MASAEKEDILEEDFRVLKSLGCGTFGEVKLVCHLPTNARVAVKILEKNNNSLTDIASEVNILQAVEHENIVRFFHVADTETTTYMFMEYVEGEDLEMCLRGRGCLKEKEARHIFRQLVSAVHFLHQRRIAHRDIKLENILIDGAGHVKLCDFGMATWLAEGQMLQEICGSLLYLAPEMLAGLPYDGLAVDIWSLGIVLYVLLMGRFPYRETTTQGMLSLIASTMCPIPYSLSKSCYVLIARLLMVPPWYRITMPQLVEQPWLGHIQEYVQPDLKEIFPRVVETMCSIGYTREEIISALKDGQLNNVTATINVLKYQLRCGASHQQDEKGWLKSIPAHPLRLPLPLKRRASEPALVTSIKAGKSHMRREEAGERGKKYRSDSKLNKCLEVMPHSDDPVSEGDDALAADFTAAGDNGINEKSVHRLPGELSPPESALDGIPTAFVNIGFSVEEPSMEPDMANDQTQTASTVSRSGWKRMKKQMSWVLRALCCCCLPAPRSAVYTVYVYTLLIILVNLSLPTYPVTVFWKELQELSSFIPASVLPPIS